MGSDFKSENILSLLAGKNLCSLHMDLSLQKTDYASTYYQPSVQKRRIFFSSRQPYIVKK